jgi:membrane protein insertase Oxa1/YidC/SpoIIIJ
LARFRLAHARRDDVEPSFQLSLKINEHPVLCVYMSSTRLFCSVCMKTTKQMKTLNTFVLTVFLFVLFFSPVTILEK